MLGQQAIRFGTWEWDAAADRCRCSAETLRICGLERDPSDLRSWLACIHPEDRHQAERQVRQAVETGAPFHAEIRMVQPAGNIVWVGWQGAAPRVANACSRSPGGNQNEGHASDGGPVSGVILDRTEQRRAVELLRQQQGDLASLARICMVGELSASLAHDLSQPLCAISNYANGCLRRMQLDPTLAPELTPAIAEIGREAARAAEMVRRLQEFARGAEGTRTAVDLSELARRVLALTAAEHRRQQVRVETELLDQLPAAMAEVVQLEQVTLSLLGCLVETLRGRPASERWLLVRTAWDRPRNELELHVTDSAKRMPPPENEGSLEDYLVTRSERTRMQLTISQSLMASLGGRLWATSDTQRGASIGFSLPLSHAENA